MMKQIICVVASFQILCSACDAQKIPELARVPLDLISMKGGKITANVDECKIGLTLSSDEYFWTSPTYSDAVFYKPNKGFSKERAPYLYKPDVETYSGIYWNYKKPAPQDEPWFGLRCTEKTMESSIYVEANCPAKQNAGNWELDDAFKHLAGTKIESINGKTWSGFVVSFDSTQKTTRAIKFCLIGKKIIMGQSSYLIGQKRDFDEMIKVLMTLEFQE